MDKHVQVMCKQRNVGVQLKVRGTFWQAGIKEDRRKLHRCTVTEWSPNYEWRGKSSPGAFLFIVEGESTTYAMSEFQYKEYAGEKAVFIPIDQHRQEEAPQNDTETHLSAVQQVAGDDKKKEATRSRSKVYDHLQPTGQLSTYRCNLCQAKVKQTGNSASAMFSHLNRYHYNVYVQLVTQSRHSGVIGDNGEGHVLTRMSFKAAFAHHYQATKFWLSDALMHYTFRAEYISGSQIHKCFQAQSTVEGHIYECLCQLLKQLGFKWCMVLQTNLNSSL